MTNTNKGGYQILDLGNVDLTTSPTIEGLYELIEGTKKPIRLTRINLGGVEKHDVVSMPVVSGSDYVFEDIYGYDLSIDSDGNLSLASTKWATRDYVDTKATKQFHPLTIYGDSITVNEKNYTVQLSAMILNQDDTELSPRLTDVYNYVNGKFNRLNASGTMYNNTDSKQIYVIQLYITEGHIYVIGRDSANTPIDETRNQIDLFSVKHNIYCDDGVNAI